MTFIRVLETRDITVSPYLGCYLSLADDDRHCVLEDDPYRVTS
jgi:hypothetical protein